MSTPARTQTRFQEDHEPDSKPKRNLKKNAQPAPIGNTSSSPGPWLSEIIIDGPDANPQYESAIEILNSFYKLRPRFRTLRYPMGPHPKPDDIRPEASAKIFISDDFETLENTSLCFGEADVAALKQEDTSPNFPFMNQPDVLSGPELQEYLATVKSLVSLSLLMEDEAADVEDEDATAEERAEAEEQGVLENDKTPAPILQLRPKVTDEKINADYAAWFAEPSPENQTTFFETLSNFISGKVRMVNRDDTLSKRGEAQDLGQDFVIEMMSQLVEQQAAGKVLNEPARYLTRSWTFTKWDENTRIAEHDYRFPGTVKPGAVDSDGESSGEVDSIDLAAYQAWNREQNAVEVQDETENEYLERCKSMLGSIKDDGLRDVAGFWLAGLTEKQIASEAGISTQKVGRLKVKIRAALSAVQNAAVTK